MNRKTYPLLVRIEPVPGTAAANTFLAHVAARRCGRPNAVGARYRFDDVQHRLLGTEFNVQAFRIGRRPTDTVQSVTRLDGLTEMFNNGKRNQ